jgi:hypothetical protein
MLYVVKRFQQKYTQFCNIQNSVSVFIQEQICLKIVYQNFRFQHYSHYAMFIIKNV